MFKFVYDRLAYALIGFVLGAIIGAALWFLYDFGASVRTHAPSIHLGLRQWALYGGGLFAVIGLVFGAGVGSAAGTTSREVYHFEADREPMARVPGWMAVTVLLLILVALAVWYFSDVARAS
jgi:hypothetical protein